ncbi:hypothetical protein Ddye_001022 [Dipteronia dyeriana]|uniref:Protein FAR1-RELATED SEQUENCE n=1 Tax=Dipteronia dyeriana TaxID=168575 RepID=A0AAD9XNE1_9ROSI|nr:hypothetical protein Ddye_001022 [Dipteronia dyeriana]
MFISNQNKGIAKAMEIVYPNATHGLCGFHMVMNIKNRFKREDVTGIFKRASKCYKESEFIDEMNQFRRVHPKAYDYLMKIGKEKWSCAYSPVRRYDMLTSSIAECLNSCLRHARQMHVTALIEFIRDMMQKWFHDHLNHAETLRTQLTTWATTLLNQRNEEFTMFTVQPIDRNEFLVKDGDKDGMAGRPKKSRIPSSGEYRGKKSRTCSWCKQAGHDCQNCPTPLGFTVSSTSETQPTQTRKQHKCSGCRGLGHNKRICSHGQTSTTDLWHDEDVIGA